MNAPALELSCSLEGARQYLNSLLSVMHFLRLYEQCFPRELQDDLASGATLLPTAPGYYSECETNFFHLVNTHYFPLPIESLPEDMFGERVLAEYIPIEPIYLSFDSDEQGYEEWSLGWKLLDYLLNPRSEERLRLFYDENDLFSIPIKRTGRVDSVLLERRCEVQGGMLAHFALAKQVLMNDTPSVWLNVTLDEPCMDAYWTKEDMVEIREEYQLGLILRARADAFCAWLEADPSRHFSLVARLWNACFFDPREKERPPRRLQLPAGTTCTETFPRYWVPV